MISFGGGMIFPDSYLRDAPEPPECPCEDGEPCEYHDALIAENEKYAARAAEAARSYVPADDDDLPF